MPNETEVKGLNQEQRAWLARYLGAKVPWKVTVQREGQDVDADELYKELQEFDKAVKSGEEFETWVLIEKEELRRSLQNAGLPSVVEKSAEFDAARSKKDEELKKIRDLIELQKQEIAASTDYTVEVQRGTLPGTKTVHSKKGGQAEKEHSDIHYKGRVKVGPTPEQAKALKFVISQLELITEQLRKAEEVTFSPNELMDEIWTPLVREQIISEHQCPSEFSRIIQLWKGATTLYNEVNKQKAREEKEAFGTAQELLADADKLLGIGAAFADVILTALGTGAKSKEILKLVAKCSQAGVRLVSNALAKDLEKCTDNIGDIFAAAIPAPFGKVTKGAFLAAANGGMIAVKLSERDNKGAGELLGKAINNAFSAIGDGTDIKVFGTIGATLETTISTAIAGGEIAKLLQADPIDSQAVLQAIRGMAEKQVKLAVSEVLKYEKHDKESKAQEKEHKSEEGMSDSQKKDEVKSLEKKQEQEAAAYEKAIEQLSALFEGKKAPDQEAIDEAAIKNSADQTNEELDRAQAEFTKRMSVAFGVGLGSDAEDNALLTDLYDIDKLIAQIESDRAQLELLSALLDIVGGIVALLVPQLGGIVKAKQFAMNVVAAVRRSQELVTFTGLLNDAKKATSPQAHTLLAQVDELKHQLTNDTISAALQLGEAIALTAASACEMSGVGAGGTAAARAVAGGLEALEQTNEFLYGKFKDRKVKRAWQNYRAALDNPEDRIGIMKAIRGNPTLAKYGMAYGALEMGDPFAKEALRKCGLNDMVLAQEKTNADKVVKFLEVKFADDIKVVGVVSVFAPDSGDPLTFASWAKNKAAAQKADGKTMLDTSPTNNIDSAFSAVDASRTLVGKSDLEEAEDFTPWKTHLEGLKKLTVALRALKPKTTTGTPFEQFQDYLNELASEAEREATRVAQDIAEEESVRTESVKLYEAAIASVASSVEAINKVVNEISAPPNPYSPEDIVKLCNEGPVKTLANQLKEYSAKSANMKEPVGFVEQAVKFTGKKAEKSLKLADNKHQEALDALVDELKAAVTRLNHIGTTSKESLDKISSALGA